MASLLTEPFQRNARSPILLQGGVAKGFVSDAVDVSAFRLHNVQVIGTAGDADGITVMGSLLAAPTVAAGAFTAAEWVTIGTVAVGANLAITAPWRWLRIVRDGDGSDPVPAMTVLLHNKGLEFTSQ